jgi:trk system potassium uptake protein
MKIIIIGCGRVGSGLAKMLSLRNHQVTVIDNDPLTFEALGPSFKGKTICGIGFDREVLKHAGIDRCDAVAAVTSSDDANIVAARMAKKFYKVPRVAARLYDPRKAEIYRRFGLQTISPVSLGISRLAEILTFSQMNVVGTIGTGEVDCIELEVTPLLIGRTVSQLNVPGEFYVIAISRNGKTILPSSGTLFEEGDLLHMAILTTSTERLKKMLE